MTETFAVPQRPPDYADVFSGPLNEPSRSAREIMEFAFSQSPRWFLALFWLRNQFVKLFGLKTEMEGQSEGAGINMMTKMPVVVETDSVLATGLSDKHLDFMITVEKTDGPNVSLTTQIWFNAILGKLYLIAVLPIHKRILKYYIRQLGKPS